MARRQSALAEEVLVKLIKEVKKRECLWNPENEDHGDRFHVVKAWGEIADVIKLPDEVIRAKWKNLRDMFKKEAKKNRNRDEYRGKWRFYKMLTFIARPSDKDESEEIEYLEQDNSSEAVEIETEPAFNEKIIKFEILPEPEDDYITCESGEITEDPIPDKKRKLSNDEDYDVMFLKSLAPYFKELDPIRKLVVRSKMQDMLLNEVAAQASSKKVFKTS